MSIFDKSVNFNFFNFLSFILNVKQELGLFRFKMIQTNYFFFPNKLIVSRTSASSLSFWSGLYINNFTLFLLIYKNWKYLDINRKNDNFCLSFNNESNFTTIFAKSSSLIGISVSKLTNSNSNMPSWGKSLLLIIQITLIYLITLK